MDYADYSEELKKICADIQREMDQNRVNRFLKHEMRDWQDRIASEIFNHATPQVAAKPPSGRDATAEAVDKRIREMFNIDVGMFASFPGSLHQKATAKPPSERDAAACRAVGIGQSVPNGRPQFFIPDLGE